MSTYFIQNYRKKKEDYIKSDELYVFVRYYSDGIGDGRTLNVRTGVKCKIKDWNPNWSKSRKREPIKKTDKDFKEKNLILLQKESEIKNIVTQIILGNKIPSIDLVKSHLRKVFERKKESSITEIHFLVLLDLFHKHVNSKNNHTSINTKRTSNGSIKDIKRFSYDYQNKNKIKLLISDIDDKWMWGFIHDCDERGLQPSTIKKRLGILSQFGRWCNKEHKVMYIISQPSNFKVQPKNDIIFLDRDEVNSLIEFDEFEINNPKHKEHLTFNHKEIEYIIDRVNTKRNDGKVIYTSYEVYKDMLLFLCGTGMRFGDMVKLRMDDYTFRKGDRTEGSFSFIMEKTNTKVVVPIEGYLHHIFKKYSRSKKYRQNYFIFPRTEFGNPISNQKFNQHIKSICKIVKLNRSVSKPKFTLGGKVVDGSDKKIQLWEVVSSHIGRRTFIREHIESGTPTRIIMKITGHRSQKVFDGYYDILEKDIEGVNRNLYKSNSLLETSLKKDNTTDSSQKEVDLKKLKSLYDKGLLPEIVYHEEVRKLI